MSPICQHKLVNGIIIVVLVHDSQDLLARRSQSNLINAVTPKLYSFWMLQFASNLTGTCIYIVRQNDGKAFELMRCYLGGMQEEAGEADPVNDPWRID